MKKIYRNLVLAGTGGLLCVLLAMPADAQRRGGGGGGFSGGGRGGMSGGGGFSRGGMGSGGFNRGGGFSAPSQRPNNNMTDGRRGGLNRDLSQAPNASSRPNGGSFGNRGNNNFSYRPNTTFGRRGANDARLGFGGGGFNRGGRYYPGRTNYGNRFYGNRFYGRTSGPWGRYGGYYYNRGFYGNLYYPRLGFGIGALPLGYYPFYWGGLQFYYSNGYYYQYNDSQYTVVEPPVGAAINSLPDGAEPISINGEQYYELNGVYYSPVTRDDGSVVYEIAGKDGQLDTDNSPAAVTIPEAHVGEIVTDLPPDSRKVKLNGEKYFVSPDDYYYQEIEGSDGSKAYKVVATPVDADEK